MQPDRSACLRSPPDPSSRPATNASAGGDVAADRAPGTPLCVDLDGTLVATDVFVESLCSLLARAPWLLLLVPLWLVRGRAAIKREVARRMPVDAATLPYRPHVLHWVRSEAASGRRVYLTTAADALHARAIADAAACFAGTMASDGVVNLKACDKALVLCGCFGERGFDYMGNHRVDAAVWSHARHALVVGSMRLARETARLVPVVRHWEPAATGVLGYARGIVAAVRVHQWVKNLLVFVPIVAAHRIGEPRLWAEAMLAFASFTLVASGAYVQNDLADIVADRRHAYKRRRPFAAGTLSPLVGAAIVPLAYASGGLVALLLPPAFGMWLLAYLVLTTAYTFWLKRVPIADVVVLAGLYALRVAAGGAATGIVLSSWLIAFSACLFLSLALVKREVELHGVRRRGLHRAEGRAYHLAHLRRVRIGGALAATGAVVVLFIYVLHPDVMRLYRRPHLLWLGCLVLGAWLAHLWRRTAGGHVHDDPVVFALRDPWSYVASVAFALTIAAAA